MGTNKDTQATKHVPLRGYERMLTLTHASMKIAHVMRIRGALTLLIQRLPRAFQRTFNKHPRMRVLQSTDQVAMAIVQPHMRSAAEAEPYVHVHQLQIDERWETRVIQECEEPFDRVTSFPFAVSVYLKPGKGDKKGHERDTDHEAVLVLYSDHYMSDGYSGLVVLHSILTEASSLYGEDDKEDEVEEFPLRESLYEMWVKKLGWMQSLRTLLVRTFGLSVAQKEFDAFQPLIQLDPRHGDFTLQSPALNSSAGFFEQGTRENMAQVLARCKEEKVTFGGALVAAVFLAHYQTWSALPESERGPAMKDGRFHMSFEMDYNIRKRVPHPVAEDPVGMYVVTNTLDSFSRDGVDLNKMRFWDFARHVRKEIQDTINGTGGADPAIFLDAFTSQIAAQKGVKLRIRQSVTGDVNVSSVGRYPFATEHSLEDNENGAKVAIDSLFVYNNMPHMSDGSVMYITSVSTFNYAMVHKYPSATGQSLFHHFVHNTEHIGSVRSDETLAQVAARWNEEQLASLQ